MKSNWWARSTIRRYPVNVGAPVRTTGAANAAKAPAAAAAAHHTFADAGRGTRSSGRAEMNPATATAAISQPVAGASAEMDVPAVPTTIIPANPQGSTSTGGRLSPARRRTSRPHPALAVTASSGNTTQLTITDGSSLRSRLPEDQ